MIRPYDPPAIIQPARDLFSWAKEEADAIHSMRERLAVRQVDLATVTAIVEESGEFGEVEELKASLKKAKDAALDCDAVLRAKQLLAKGRKALKAVAAVSKAKAIAGEVKALKGVVEEGKSRLASGLAAGKVPA